MPVPRRMLHIQSMPAVIRSLFCCLFIALASFGADELHVTELSPLNLPRFSTNALGYPGYIGVAVSGTNAITFWDYRAGDWPSSGGDSARPFTNVFFSRLDAAGRPFGDPPLAIAPHVHAHWQALAAPAGSGFFVLLREPSVSNLRQTNVYVTRVGLDGSTGFPPVLLSTNGATFDIASNGRTLFYAERTPPRESVLNYRLIDFNGAILAQGTLPNSLDTAAMTLTATTDGEDYVLAWETRPIFARTNVRLTRFSGRDGTFVTKEAPNARFAVSNLSNSTNGFLLLAYDPGQPTITQILHYANDLSEVARTNRSSIYAPGAIAYPDGACWTLFYSISQSTRSYAVTPTNGALVLTSNPYPVVTNRYFGVSKSLIVPFGDQRYLLTGGTVLTKSGLSSGRLPPNYGSQTLSSVVASPFGFLVIWHDSNDIRGRRFAKDGTPLDADAFTISDDWPAYDIKAVFDSNDYALTWLSYTLAEMRVVRVAPIGAPDLRVSHMNFESYNLKLLSHKGELFTYYSSSSDTTKDLHIRKIGADGQSGIEMVTHGDYLVTDSANLYALAWDDPLEVYTTKLLISESNVVRVATNVIGSLSPRSGGVYTFPPISLRNGFVVQLSDTNAHWYWAYFSDGKQRFRMDALSTSWTDFAESDDYVLRAARIDLSNRWLFEAFDSTTGEKLPPVERNLGTVNALSIASAGKDFLAVTDSVGGPISYVGKFWITTTKPPSFTSPQITNTDLESTLVLNPERRYRIETSPDLLDWTLEQVVSGVSAFQITTPLASQGFVRAILVPE
jgi:hypothetical protein